MISRVLILDFFRQGIDFDFITSYIMGLCVVFKTVGDNGVAERLSHAIGNSS
jgi:hypothetical protein